VTIKCVTQPILFSGFGGRKAPSSLGKISTAEVLRLRAPSAVSRDKAVRRCAQDDVFVRGLEIQLVGICRKHVKIEKVTGSQDEVFVGVLKKNISRKLAPVGRSPFERASVWSESI
jgi:hypothetical protein